MLEGLAIHGISYGGYRSERYGVGLVLVSLEYHMRTDLSVPEGNDLADQVGEGA